MEMQITALFVGEGRYIAVGISTIYCPLLVEVPTKSKI